MADDQPTWSDFLARHSVCTQLAQTISALGCCQKQNHKTPLGSAPGCLERWIWHFSAFTHADWVDVLKCMVLSERYTHSMQMLRLCCKVCTQAFTSCCVLARGAGWGGGREGGGHLLWLPATLCCAMPFIMAQDARVRNCCNLTLPQRVCSGGRRCMQQMT